VDRTVSHDGNITPEDQQEILAILADVPSWRMTPDQWVAADLALQSLAGALATGSAAAFAQATAALELAGPQRIRIRLGDEQQPPPEPVRDRINRLQLSQ
jgi:hypothetical protein